MIADPNWGTSSTWGPDIDYEDGLTFTYTCTISSSGSDRTDSTWPSQSRSRTYYYHRDSYIKREEVAPSPPPPLSREPILYSDEGQHWVPTKKVRDNRQAIWACRPRHGLSGR